MVYSARIQEDDEGQFFVLPEACRLNAQSVLLMLNEQTGIITLSPNRSETSEISQAQRLPDIQTMSEMNAATAKAADPTGDAA